MKNALDQRDPDRRQPITRAGASDAMAVADAKNRSMGRADDMLAGQIEELIFYPIERPARMGTRIDVARDIRPATHDEDRPVLEFESLAARIRNVVEAAEGQSFVGLGHQASG
jgi:hypothetical protein